MAARFRPWPAQLNSRPTEGRTAPARSVVGRWQAGSRVHLGTLDGGRGNGGLNSGFGQEKNGGKRGKDAERG